MDILTPYQKLALVRAITRHTVRLEQFEELKGFMQLDDSIILLISTAQFSTSRTSCVITATGTKTVCIERTSGGWAAPRVSYLWDDGPVTTRVVADLPSTPAHERTEWEQMCYRPGNPANPVDSHARQLQGYDY